jgi:hypothetical protein
VDLPQVLGNRHFELTFDAIAKVSDVWVNGLKVVNHTGMFGQVKCDITKAVRPGRNVIAVHVISRNNPPDNNPHQVQAVAVTVDITSNMLYSLPHGMFQDGVGGIWQPVTLTATAPVFVKDCFIEPGLHGADIHLDVQNAGDNAEQLGVSYKIVSVSNGGLLYSNDAPVELMAQAGASHLKITTPHLDPKLGPLKSQIFTLSKSHCRARGQQSTIIVCVLDSGPFPLTGIVFCSTAIHFGCAVRILFQTHCVPMIRPWRIVSCNWRMTEMSE